MLTPTSNPPLKQLCEMFRRFLLVGLLSVVDPGSILQLVVATTSNDILHRFFAGGGDYSLDKAGVAQTLSPSMDIMLPYNAWRLLYVASGCDASAASAASSSWPRRAKKGEASATQPSC